MTGRRCLLNLVKEKKIKKIKICRFCGNPINGKPESKKEKNKRIMNGINELKRKGIFQ